MNLLYVGRDPAARNRDPNNFVFESRIIWVEATKLRRGQSFAEECAVSVRVLQSVETSRSRVLASLNSVIVKY